MIEDFGTLFSDGFKRIGEVRDRHQAAGVEKLTVGIVQRKKTILAAAENRFPGIPEVIMAGC